MPVLQKKADYRSLSLADEKPRVSIFRQDNSDTNDEMQEVPKIKLKKQKLNAMPSAMECRISSKLQKAALAQDSTVFQYDEVYDVMVNKRDMEMKGKYFEPKKAKYIKRLLACAERRKLENELRVERQVQKEREQEGDDFKDKEKFVTKTYRKKLEEMRKLAEHEKREEYLESIGDVTKQKDLDGFYRYIYEQKLGNPKVKELFSENQKENRGNDIKYKPIKSDVSQGQRIYRKRCTSEDEDPSVYRRKSLCAEKKAHLENNIDADSDFSIDSSSSDEEKFKLKLSKKANLKATSLKKRDGNSIHKCSNTVQKVLKHEIESSLKVEGPGTKKNDVNAEEIQIAHIIDTDQDKKNDIWNKRTVKHVFEAALQRYYQRKSGR